jgi:hypothetical protein
VTLTRPPASHAPPVTFVPSPQPLTAWFALQSGLFA